MGRQPLPLDRPLHCCVQEKVSLFLLTNVCRDKWMHAYVYVVGMYVYVRIHAYVMTSLIEREFNDLADDHGRSVCPGRVGMRA